MRRFLALGLLVLAACAPPIGVEQLSPVEANRAQTDNILSTNHLSVHATGVLQRLGLRERFDHDPAAVLLELHQGRGGFDQRVRTLALSELSFAHALEGGDRGYFFAAAAYAWAFLIETPENEDRLDRYDERFRLAADLYNRGIALGLQQGEKPDLDVTARQVPLFFGSLDIQSSPDMLVRGGYRLERFASLADYDVHGLRNHYRRRGLGAPTSAHIKPLDNAKGSWITPQAKLPATLLLVFKDVGAGLDSGRLSAEIEILDPNADTVATVDGVTVPLETDLSAALAYRLEGSPLWDFEIAGFRSGDLMLGRKDDTGLYMLAPYQPGRIPVIFVHGTASSPARWAQMANELQSDPQLARAYQLWFFMYNTGNPISFSASKLRDGIRRLVADVDPNGADAALRRMVLIGHSQGGLIVRMMVTDSGTRFWDNVTSTPFEQVELSPESRKLALDVLFFEPLPTVERVIFCATPHRGSFVAENWMGNLGRRLVSIPANVLKVGADLVTLQRPDMLKEDFRVPTAVDNMRHTNPFIVALSSLPMSPDVHVNSIVAVKGDGPAEIGNDGVVRYESAHLEEAESELVVRSSHSVQENPVAIEEVRRILYLHLGKSPTAAHVQP